MLIVYFRSGNVLEASILVGMIGQQLNNTLKRVFHKEMNKENEPSMSHVIVWFHQVELKIHYLVETFLAAC